MKKRYGLDIQGTSHRWSFQIDATPEHVEDWRADGLKVDEIVNVIPARVVDIGLLKVWVFLEDLLYFRNPFK